MSLFSRLRDRDHPRNNDRSRKQRRARSRAHTQAPSLVELLEDRLLLSAIVTTDKQDYPPGSTALIRATNDANPGPNFLPGETGAIPKSGDPGEFGW